MNEQSKLILLGKNFSDNKGTSRVLEVRNSCEMDIFADKKSFKKI